MFSLQYPGALPKVNPILRISVKTEGMLFRKKQHIGVAQISLRSLTIEPNKYNDDWYSLYRDGIKTDAKIRVSFMFSPMVLSKDLRGSRGRALYCRQQSPENALFRKTNTRYDLLLHRLSRLQEIASHRHRRQHLQMQSLRNGRSRQLQRASVVHLPMHSSGPALTERQRRRSQRESAAID